MHLAIESLMVVVVGRATKKALASDTDAARQKSPSALLEIFILLLC